tara:strand:- start:1392 stop:1712 length:321 start_codon:yes stop_codon:yes gene_type:complete
MRFTFTEGDLTGKGFYELNPFPGCNQLVISNHAFIYPKFRGKGLGTIAHKERLKKAKELGYDCLLCTCKSSNTVQLKILAKNGWTKIWSFRNNETDSDVEIWIFQL